MIVVVMGVAGSGKTTIGAMLAGRLGWEYAEADAFHPKANVDKMHAGTTLTDEDRWPWLERIGGWIDDEMAAGRSAVVTCSALKRAYRNLLSRPGNRLVYLNGSKELISRRLAARTGHFFPAALVDTQFADLEPPGPDEDPIVVGLEARPAEIVDAIIAALNP